MKKKAQSALEFLTTYGWAFLVILIMIGALAYFGVLDPNRFLPEEQQPPKHISELSCDAIKAHYINEDFNRFTFNETYGESSRTTERALFMEFIDRCYSLITVQ